MCVTAYLYACVHRVSVGMALGPVVLSLLYEANGGSFRQPLLLLASANCIGGMVMACVPYKSRREREEEDGGGWGGGVVGASEEEDDEKLGLLAGVAGVAAGEEGQGEEDDDDNTAGVDSRDTAGSSRKR